MDQQRSIPSFQDMIQELDIRWSQSTKNEAILASSPSYYDPGTANADAAEEPVDMASTQQVEGGEWIVQDAACTGRQGRKNQCILTEPCNRCLSNVVKCVTEAARHKGGTVSRFRRACEECRRRKIKCSRTRPRDGCQSKGVDCVIDRQQSQAAGKTQRGPSPVPPTAEQGHGYSRASDISAREPHISTSPAGTSSTISEISPELELTALRDFEVDVEYPLPASCPAPGHIISEEKWGEIFETTFNSHPLKANGAASIVPTGNLADGPSPLDPEFHAAGALPASPALLNWTRDSFLMDETPASSYWFIPAPEGPLTGGDAEATHQRELRDWDTPMIEERPCDFYDFTRSTRACIYEPQSTCVAVHWNEIEPMPTALAAQTPYSHSQAQLEPMSAPFQPLPGYGTQLYGIDPSYLAPHTSPNTSPVSPSVFWSDMGPGFETSLHNDLCEPHGQLHYPQAALEQAITHFEDSILFER